MLVTDSEAAAEDGGYALGVGCWVLYGALNPLPGPSYNHPGNYILTLLHLLDFSDISI